jgi:hypothetical protein
VAELVEAGELEEVAVEGWSQKAYVPSGTRPKQPQRQDAAFLSPFDLLIQDRERTRRLFGFNYQIEVYVPEPKRQYGYYVLPVLLGDELVGRLDLKADRQAGTLRVLGAFAEPEARPPDPMPILQELQRMKDWLGLARVDIAANGDLAPILASATM